MTSRLTAQDWVAAGFAALARHGAAGLKADVLAKTLKVSRGSFYWHFANLDAFHLAVLQRWEAISTEAIIDDLERSADHDRLPRLIRAAFKADTSLERGMRAWAAGSDEARAAVEVVDGRRVAYIAKLLAAGGLSPDIAETRARVLNWTYLGRVLSPAKVSGVDLDRLVDELVRLAY